ncbi:MAG TPA: hypothetical protein VHN80_26995, partial [Kineosporiaceae bacterium]|nr:hypothetical protein [Kineosporiaceae bacterium]
MDALTLADQLLSWARHEPIATGAIGGAVIVVAVLLVRAADLTVARLRHHRLVRHAHQVRITPPPQVETAGAAVFWANLAELLAAAPRRRRLYGNTHVALEYRWAGRQLSILAWVPGTVPATLVAAAARAAWPGTTTTIQDADPPVPCLTGGDDLAEGGSLTLAMPAGYPLRTDHDADPLRPLIHAAAGLTTGEHAAVHVLARPATPRQSARLRSRATALRTGRPTGNGVGGLLDATLRGILDLLTP